MPTASLEQRSTVLGQVEGIAIKADSLLKMSKSDGRSFLKGKQVIYIYHNLIDATGDSASTEDDTFVAVDTTIQELSSLVRHLVNNFGATTIFVTADHGFLFHEAPPQECDKNKLPQKPEGTVKYKKRYLLGSTLPNHPAVWRGDTKVTAGADGPMQFWVPKAANLFHFAGGARFVHGGAMPQEIAVPVLSIKQTWGKASEKTEVKQVGVQVLTSSNKITTSRHRFRLMQTEKVSERVMPVTLQLGIYDDSDPVTNIETITFNSVSDDFKDREKSVWLSLKDHPFDKTKNYHLVLRNADTGIETQRVAVIIDKAFDNDF